MTVRSSPGTKVFSRDKKTVDTVLEEPRAPGGAPVCSRTALFQLSGQTPPNQGRTETRDLAPLQTHLALSARLFWELRYAKTSMDIGCHTMQGRRQLAERFLCAGCPTPN